MSLELPRPSVSPSSVVLSAPGRSVTTSLEVVNRGGGRLSATIESSVAWIKVDPGVIDDNHVRVAITVDVAALEEDVEALAALTLRYPNPLSTDQLALEIPVRVTRTGMCRAFRLYADGQLDEAREICRNIAYTAVSGEASILLAIIALDRGEVAGAVRPLLDAGASSIHGSVPAETLAHFLDVLEARMPELRDAHYAVGVLERLEADARLQGTDLEARLAEVLTASCRRFVDDYRPRLLNASELSRMVERVTRELRRSPDDEGWKAWLQEAEEAPKYEVPQPPEAGRPRRPRLWIGLGSLILVAAISLFWVYPRLEMQKVRTLMRAGAYREAMVEVQHVHLLWQNSDDLRRLRAQILFAWGRSMFNSGNEREGARHLDIAMHEDPSNMRIRAYRRVAYRRWGAILLARGLVPEGYEALEEITGKGPEDAPLRARLKLLAPIYELYVNLEALSNGPVGPHGAALPRKTGRNPNFAGCSRILAKNNLPWFDRRMQVLFVDLWGNGRNQVAIAGNNDTGEGGVFVFAPVGLSRASSTENPPAPHASTPSPSPSAPAVTGSTGVGVAPHMKELLGYVDPDGCLLQGMRVVSFERGGRPALLVNWRSPVSGLGHGVLIWGDGRGAHEWHSPEGVTPVEVKDTDHDGHPNLWTSILIGDRAHLHEAVLLPISYSWAPHGPLLSTQNHADYYNDTVLPQLRKEIKHPPYPPSDPRRARYVRNRETAIKRVEDMTR